MRDYKQDVKSAYRELGKDLNLDDPAFANGVAKPLNPSSLDREFKRILNRAGIEKAGFHDLRYTFASLMLLRGARPKVISGALSHASVAFTLNTYSHIIEGMQSEAMALLDEILPAGVNGVGRNNANLTPSF